MPEHVVEQGECLSSIADQYGFSWRSLWKHSRNAELRRLRQDPNVLFPGDVVYIPDKELKTESRPTDRMHTFVRTGVPEKLRILLLLEGQPRKNAAYTLDIDGKLSHGQTDGEGRVALSIPPGARRGKLILADGGEEIELDLGCLDPITEITGVQARLMNLGFELEVTGEWDEPSVAAVREFRRMHRLPSVDDPAEAPDDALRDKLKELYGS